ncbi:hypothetical protein ACQPW3_13460 [Actinosynnema sp. CA-248983]
MAATVQGTRATEQHRREQARTSALLVREVLSLWSLLDPRRLDATAPAWLRLVLDLVDGYRDRSARLAADYLTRFRLAEIGRTPPNPLSLPDDSGWRDAAAVSLLVTGPSTVKKLTGAGLDPQAAADKAGPLVAAAALRHGAAGGRDLIHAARDRDPVISGFRRVTSAKPCAFCAMLAARSAMPAERRTFYASAWSAGDRVRDGEPDPFHDDCLCTVEPVYRDDSAPPAAAAGFAQLWVTSTEGYSGKDARNAFRRAYEAQLRAAA